MSDVAKTAKLLTEMNVSSISPGMGMFLVRVAGEVSQVLEGLSAKAPERPALERYLSALNTITEMAAHQQAAVIGVLERLVRQEGRE